MSTLQAPVQTPVQESVRWFRTMGQLARVAEHDGVTPAQFQAVRGLERGERERLLMAAVFERAVEDLTVHAADTTAYAQSEACRSRETAVEWFASEDTTWPFSVRNVCDVLGLDLGAVRRAVARIESPPMEHRPYTRYRARPEPDSALLALEEWGWLLRRARQRCGLTQDQLGAKLGSGSWRIGDMERGAVPLSEAAMAWVRERIVAQHG
jgi:hypothetical protein